MVASSSAPGKPTNVAATAGNGQATITFSRYPLDSNWGCAIAAEGNFGIIAESDSVMREQVDALVTTGASWLRTDIVFQTIESGSLGTRDWSSYDRVFAYARSKGLRVLGIATTLPAAVSGGDWSVGPTSGTQRTAYANSCAAAAAHFVGSIALDAIELWNEPSGAQAWSPSPSVTAYGQMVQAAYPAIKAVNSQLPVIAGGIYPEADISGLDWFNGLYSGGYTAYLDALTLHPYANFDTSGIGSEGFIPTARGIMNSHGDSAKALWSTEMGAPTHGSSSTSDANQAAMLTRCWNYWVANAGVRGPMLFYTFNDKETYAANGDRESYFGIRYTDGSHKPEWNSLTSITAANNTSISYTVTASPGGRTATGSGSPLTVTGLTNGTAYTFTATGSNASGAGVASAASNSVTPTGSVTAPGPPTGVAATSGDSQATVNFTAPSSNGGAAIIDYTATSSPGGLTGTATTSPITVTSLVNGTPYTFTVKARNSVGLSAASTASNSVTPAASGTVPSIPLNVIRSATQDTATISWSAPASNGGSSITGYFVGRDGNTIWDTGPWSTTDSSSTTTQLFIDLLPNASYTLTVAAINANGTGVPSNGVVVTGVLPAPANLRTTSVGSTSVGLTWYAVTGASGYEVTVS